jgi:fatty-acyl-CoA synthase
MAFYVAMSTPYLGKPLMTDLPALGMPGMMQSWPLTLDKIIRHACKWHGGREVISRNSDGMVERASYADVYREAKNISEALLREGVQPGDRVATLAFNHCHHLAAWYGIMGIGAVCHTLNPRLHAEQLVYIINHAQDRVVFADADQVQLLKSLLPRCPTVERVILLDAHITNGDAIALSEFVDDCTGECRWGQFDEALAAGLCYTSGTTGNPKGVLYSHRSNYLLAMNTVMPDAFCLSEREVIMPIVPMFHANSWGLAFSAPLVGAKLVLPGPRLDGASVYELIATEGVTFSAGVPTVWQALIDHCHAEGITSMPLRRVVVGGSACPETMVEQFAALGVEVLHAWGMTELSPVGLTATPTAAIDKLSSDEQRQQALKQGRVVGIDAEIMDEDGTVLPHDGQTSGRLLVRGPNVVERYYGHQESALDSCGWLDTGDIATIDMFGYVRITDRAKDIIKSGGEWISSVDIENEVMGHDAVALAAVIAVPHDKWGERPKLLVQLIPGALADPEEFRSYLASRIAKWWMPDEIVIIDVIPLGATGKIDKKAIRDAA